MIDRLTPAFFVVLALCACDYSSIKDETSELYAVPVGSSLVLNSEITIPPHEVSVLMQDGVMQESSNINYYYPNCKFELYSISQKSRIVKPDQFVITKVVDENEYTELEKVQYASRFMRALDAPETITYATVMYLHSDVQPDVYRMTCKHWESVVDSRYLTISEMRKAMGEIFTLKITL